MPRKGNPWTLVLAAAIPLGAWAGCQAPAAPTNDGLFSRGPLATATQSLKTAFSPPQTPSRKAATPVQNEALSGRNYAQVQFALGQSMEKSGKLQAAEAAYEATIRNDGRHAKAYHRLALLRERTGHSEQAEDLFRKAIERDPRNPDLLCDYGYWCYLRRQWDSAETNFRRAIQLDPNHARAHNNLGLVLARTDRSDEALAHFRAAGLDAADAHANLGFIHLTEQRWQQAEMTLRHAQAQKPRSENVDTMLAGLSKVHDQQHDRQHDRQTVVPVADEPAMLQRLPAVMATDAPVERIAAHRGQSRENKPAESGLAAAFTQLLSFESPLERPATSREPPAAQTVARAPPVESTAQPARNVERAHPVSMVEHHRSAPVVERTVPAPVAARPPRTTAGPNPADADITFAADTP